MWFTAEKHDFELKMLIRHQLMLCNNDEAKQFFVSQPVCVQLHIIGETFVFDCPHL